MESTVQVLLRCMYEYRRNSRPVLLVPRYICKLYDVRHTIAQYSVPSTCTVRVQYGDLYAGMPINYEYVLPVLVRRLYGMMMMAIEQFRNDG